MTLINGKSDSQHLKGRQFGRQIKARNAYPIVSHPIVNVKTTGLSDICTMINTCWKYNVGNRSYTLVREVWG